MDCLQATKACRPKKTLLFCFVTAAVTAPHSFFLYTLKGDNFPRYKDIYAYHPLKEVKCNALQKIINSIINNQIDKLLCI